MGRRRTWTDTDLRLAVDTADNLYQVCQLLNIAPGKRTYVLLRRHIARLDLDATRFPKVEHRTARGRRGGWTDADLPRLVAESRSTSEVLRRLGYQPNGGMHRFVTKKIRSLDLDTSHFVGQDWSKGTSHTHTRRPLDGDPRRELRLHEHLAATATADRRGAERGAVREVRDRRVAG